MDAIAKALVLNKVNNDVVPNMYEQSPDYSYDAPLKMFQSFKKDLMAAPTTTLDAVLKAFSDNSGGGCAAFKQTLVDACKTKKKALESDFAAGTMTTNVLKAIASATKSNIVWCDARDHAVHFGGKPLKEALPCHAVVGDHGNASVAMLISPIEFVRTIVRSGCFTENDLECIPAAWLKDYSQERKMKKCEIIKKIMADASEPTQ